MPTTIETTVYTLQELKQLADESNDRRAYEKALNWVNEVDLEVFTPHEDEPFNYIPEPAFAHLVNPSITEWDVNPTDATVKADGFTDVYALLAECGLTSREVNALRRAQEEFYLERQNSYYARNVNRYKVVPNSDYYGNPKLAKLADKAADLLNDWYSEMQSDTARAIADNYEYYLTEEAALESAEANEWTFTKGGERFG